MNITANTETVDRRRLMEPSGVCTSSALLYALHAARRSTNEQSLGATLDVYDTPEQVTPAKALPRSGRYL